MVPRNTCKHLLHSSRAALTGAETAVTTKVPPPACLPHSPHMHTSRALTSSPLPWHPYPSNSLPGPLCPSGTLPRPLTLATQGYFSCKRHLLVHLSGLHTVALAAPPKPAVCQTSTLSALTNLALAGASAPPPSNPLTSSISSGAGPAQPPAHACPSWQQGLARRASGPADSQSTMKKKSTVPFPAAAHHRADPAARPRSPLPCPAAHVPAALGFHIPCHAHPDCAAWSEVGPRVPPRRPASRSHSRLQGSRQP